MSIFLRITSRVKLNEPLTLLSHVNIPQNNFSLTLLSRVNIPQNNFTLTLLSHVNIPQNNFSSEFEGTIDGRNQPSSYHLIALCTMGKTNL
jgi:hypothetical protein